MSECPRCRETLDALYRAQPREELSPESATRVAEAEVVEPGAPPPWRLKPAPPPAPEVTYLLRTVGPTILFLTILAVVILADVHLRRSMETGDAARVAAVQARARRGARRRARATRMNQKNDELALNEVRPEPAARAPMPGAGGAFPAAAQPVPDNVYSNPLFQAAPRAGHPEPSHSRGAAAVPAQAKTQSNAQPKPATSVVAQSASVAPSRSVKPAVKPLAKVASNTLAAWASSLASSMAAPSAEGVVPSAAGAPSATAVARASEAASAAAVAPAKAAVPPARPSSAQSATGSNSPSHTRAATNIASAATKKEAAPVSVASAAPAAKTASAATAFASKAGSSEIASEPSHKLAPPKARQFAGRKSRTRKVASNSLARRQAKRLAELRRRRHAELIASARRRNEVRVPEAARPPKATHEPPAAVQIPRLADNQNSQTGTAHADLVVASEPPQASVLPAVAPIAAGIPVPPRSVLVASPHRSVYWSLQDFGIIYRSTDRNSWQRLASGTQDDLLAGAAPSRTVCWAVGMHGTVLLTTDGVHWTRIKSPTTADLVGVTAASADVATVIARDGQHFSTFDRGSNWQRGNGESGAWRHLE